MLTKDEAKLYYLRAYYYAMYDDEKSFMSHCDSICFILLIP